MAPIAIIVFLFGYLYLYAARRLTAGQYEIRKLAVWSASLLLLFLVYPAINQKIFAVFACEDFPDIDARYLSADFRQGEAHVTPLLILNLTFHEYSPFLY